MRYSKDIYDRDVLVKTAYCFSDRAYVHLDVEGNCYTVTILKCIFNFQLARVNSSLIEITSAHIYCH